MPTIQHWQGLGPRVNGKTDGRPCSQRDSLGIVQQCSGWMDSHRYPATWRDAAAPEQGQRLSFPRESTIFNKRRCRCEASNATVSMCNVETRESATLLSCQRVGNSMLDEPHTSEDCGRRGVIHLQLQSVLVSIQSEFSRQTCRLYHDLGVGCGCRRA
jgi:hypothetical protein